MLRAIRWPIRQPKAPPEIDFGGGFFVPAEDVLDGHLKRLLRDNSHSVHVQTGRTLQSTIEVSSPELAPLTGLAEELAEIVPDTTPEPHFREELHRALELSHRQHAAQRALGTCPDTIDEKRQNASTYLIMLNVLLLTAMTFLVLRRLSRRTFA